MSAIEKLKLFNFKRFYELEVPFESDLNILIGDNESGKSSLLLAVDLVLSGNVKKVESIHIENLFNRESIESFLSGDRLPENLPVMSVELFLDEQDKPELNGKVNSDGKPCDGVKLVCEPNPDYSRAIDEVLSQDGLNFPGLPRSGWVVYLAADERHRPLRTDSGPARAVAGGRCSARS